jgi:hypothetical protein
MNSAKRLFFFATRVLLATCFSSVALAEAPVMPISVTLANEAIQTNDSLPPAVAKPATPSGIQAMTYAASGAPASQAQSAVKSSPFGSQPVSNKTLNARRGGERVFNDAELKGVVSNNVASNLSTGMNVISEGAFSGSSGLPLIVQNSGNNVLIQNSTIVNVQLK